VPKPKVVIIGIADWASSGYNACCAIKSVGEFECRHISAYDHMYECPHDVLVKIYPRQERDSFHEKVLNDSAHNKDYAEAAQLIESADMIHLWNSFPGEQCMSDIGFPINWQKVKLVTMTGSMYRDHHKEINTILKHWMGIRLTVQDALFFFPDEIDSTFIPHAVDVDSFKPSEERERTIGTYHAAYKANEQTSDWDISKIQDTLQKFPDWKIDLNYKMPWKERIEKLSKCSVFIQDIIPYIGIWGRSTLEACALEVPTLENYFSSIPVHARDKLGDIPIIHVDEDTFESELRKLTDNEEYRKEVGKKSRNWVKEHFSYPVIGKMYSDVYREVLSEI